MNAASLTKTVQEANSAARAGEGDPMGKGTGGWDRYLGDQVEQAASQSRPDRERAVLRNPDLPRRHQFDAWECASARTARCSTRTSQPVKGLYACGLDTNSIWAGLPPANGANNGPNMTFGYIVGRTLAGPAG